MSVVRLLGGHFMPPCGVGLGAYWEDPLQCERDSPGPFIVPLVEGVGGTANNNATNRPTHLERTGAGTTESQGHDLTGVGGRVRNEESPRDTFEGLSDHENFE